MAESKAPHLRLFIAAQLGIPLGLLVLRFLNDRIVGYGWGWQMFS